MLVLNVVAFAGVAAHVVERQREFVPFGHLARASAVAGRECFVTAARMGEHEFVASVAHGFQAVFSVVEQERRARRGVRHALEQAADAYAVDLLRRERRARDLREGRQQVDGRGQLVADRSGGCRPRPPHDARHALPAFEGGSLAFAKTARRAGVVAVVDPRPVVRSEHDDRIGGRAALFQRLEHFAHAPVDLMMNIHDEFRPSGFSRTYPNLLTQEGILGNEEFPDATHSTILPFTRMINGAADYTICYYDKRLKNTHAHQLAASLVFYSPLMTIFWYDRPQFYNGEPEIEWFENLQTVFDESHVLDGMPGKNITMARRKGKEWFVGMLTNNEGSAETLDCSFLDKNQMYLASIYTDGGEEVKTKTRVKCSYVLVGAEDVIKFTLKPRGGAAVRLVPVTEKEAKAYKKYGGESF